ncbi:TM0106 family RecB-like putative nuclease, partial [Patescibacteria group bacterium]
MPCLITEKTFYQFLKCPTWVYFGVHGDEEKTVEPLMQQLMDDGLIADRQKELLKNKEDLAEVTAEDLDDAFVQTVEFMREGRQTIYRGVLIDKHTVGHPDVLEKVQGQSKFGDYYYVAADFKRASDLRDEYKFQGCFYAELLKKIQKAKPVQGYVIKPDNTVLPYSIEQFEVEYRLTLDEIERIVAGDEPPHFLTSGCKQSPWFSECHGLSESCQDLSLLNRVWREEVVSLNQAGVKTVADLASKSVSDLERLVPHIDQYRLETMRDKAVALRDNKFVIKEKIDLPKSKVELFFDIESDPMRDFDYLFGVLVVGEGKEEYHSFMATSEDGQEETWQDFVKFIEAHHDAPIYHYGDFENHVVNRFADKFGVSDIARQAFDSNMIDLIYIMRP